MLPSWIDFFEELQFVRGRTQNTVAAYRHDLEFYEEFLKDKKSIPHFFEFLKKKELSPRSQARVISSVRTYLKFRERQGHKIPELQELRPPKSVNKLPKSMSFKEFQALYLAAETTDPLKTLRNQTALWLLYGLGCRVSELITLNLNDYSQQEGWFKILGKGGKERLSPIPSLLIEKVNLYLTECRPQLIRSESEKSFLINDRGHRPSRVDIWRWLAKWSKDAGFKEPVHPHRFRHGYATSLLENGADLRSLQMLLGHSSIQTTQIYTHLITSHLVRAVDEHHPMAKTTISKK